MAGVVKRNWTFDANIKDGTVNQDGVKVYLWDADSASTAFDLTTNASGNITQQSVTESIFSVTGTDTVAEDEKNPYVVSLAKYGKVTSGFNLSFTSARTDAFFIEADSFITESVKATTAAATGFTINHTADTVTLTEAKNVDNLYDKLANEAVDTPQKDFPSGIMTTVDGNNYILNYDLILNNVTFTGQSKSIQGDVEFQTGGVANNLTIDGALSYGSASSVTGLTVTGATTFTVAGTYTFTDCTIGEIINTSGGNVTITSNNSTFGTNTGPNITIDQSATFELTGLKDNTEVRLIDTSDLSDVAGVELVSAGVGTGIDNGNGTVTISGTADNNTFSFVYPYSSDINIRVQIVSVEFEIISLTSILESTNKSIPIQQVFDRNYDEGDTAFVNP